MTTIAVIRFTGDASLALVNQFILDINKITLADLYSEAAVDHNGMLVLTVKERKEDKRV